MVNLLLHEVRLRRAAIFGWALGLSFFTLLYMSIFPSLPDEMLQMDVESVDLYKVVGVRSMATFEGYILSTVFNFLPILSGAFGVFLGIGALAGEEDSGVLELLAALPISRARLVLVKAAALALVALLVMAVIALVAAGLFAALQAQIETPLTPLDLFTAALSHWLIAFVFMTLALFLGAFLPDRRSAMAAAFAALLVSFFGSNMAGMLPSLEGLRPLSPFYYFSRVMGVLAGEPSWDDAVILLMAAAVFTALAVLAFQRRSLMVGAWPWQRGRVG